MTNPDRYYLKVERFMETDKSTISRFSFPDGTNGYFLEPPGPSSIVEGSGLRISKGLYNVVTHDGARWQGVLRLENVPGRSGILIHPGLIPDHTTGCLIPGFSFASNRIFDSENAMKLLLETQRKFDRFLILIK
jgi:hypothetical protein